MQKLETRNGTLLFVEVPENISKIQPQVFRWSYIWWGFYGGNVANYPFGELDRCKDYEILGEVTKDAITFDIAQFGFSGELEKASIVYTHEDLFRYYLWDQGIHLTEGKKFIVLKEK
jgi:hypothetical protein